jgi:large subunit ribosomal protein L31e
MAEEKIITINIRKKLKEGPYWRRSDLASRIIRDILQKHSKKKIRIDKSLNEKIWQRGIQHPKTKLKIKIISIDDKTAKAELVEK